MKKCKECNIEKPTSEFYAHTSTKDRLNVRCKTCHYTYCRTVSEKRLQSSEHKEYMKQYTSKHQKEHPELWAAYSAHRRAQEFNATPKWADLKAIQLFYVNCPKGMEVDHIEPLLGKEVCGLHVLDNLQYLTPIENRSWSNRRKIG